MDLFYLIILTKEKLFIGWLPSIGNGAFGNKDFQKIQPSDIEFKLPPTELYGKYIGAFWLYAYEFSLIMGQDNLNSLHKWKNMKSFLQNHAIYVSRIGSGEMDDL
jgi:nicotinate-nucleotide adenylyltransferase